MSKVAWIELLQLLHQRAQILSQTRETSMRAQRNFVHVQPSVDFELQTVAVPCRITMTAHAFDALVRMVVCDTVDARVQQIAHPVREGGCRAAAVAVTYHVPGLARPLRLSPEEIRTEGAGKLGCIAPGAHADVLVVDDRGARITIKGSAIVAPGRVAIAPSAATGQGGWSEYSTSRRMASALLPSMVTTFHPHASYFFAVSSVVTSLVSV